MVVDWWIIEAGFVVGVAIAVLATLIYVRSARSGAQPGDAGDVATVNLNLKFAERPYNRARAGRSAGNRATAGAR